MRCGARVVRQDAREVLQGVGDLRVLPVDEIDAIRGHDVAVVQVAVHDACGTLRRTRALQRFGAAA